MSKAAIAQIYGKVIALEPGADGLYITTTNGKILKLAPSQVSSTNIPSNKMNMLLLAISNLRYIVNVGLSSL